MEFPEDLYYSKEHAWVRLVAGKAVIGVTDHAQKELGAIVFAELPEDGADIEKNEILGSLESSKTVAEVPAPISGQVLKSNRDLEEDPSLINDDPYGNGWLVSMEIDDPDELEGLLNSVEYENYLEKKDAKKEVKG
jgi:glycine cleavage system H protein